MNCGYCHTNHRKFYCVSCIKEKLQEHDEEFSIIATERDTSVAKANDFIKQTARIQRLIAEKNKRASHLESLHTHGAKVSHACAKKNQRIDELKRQIREKQQLLQEANRRKSQFTPAALDNSTVTKHWQRTHKMTVGTRRILVKEVQSLFELKPGVVEEPVSSVMYASHATVNTVDAPAFLSPSTVVETKEDLYICGVTLPTRLIDVSKYPKEELNAPIGLVVHMLGLIVRYLGIKLPFMIIQRGVRPYIRTIRSSVQLWHNDRKMPLFLEDDDKNFKRFVTGMAMLNYNLAYVCNTQNVKVPLGQVANTLQSLMACCRANDLGIQSHALSYQGIRDLNFSFDFQQVLNATKLRYRCSSWSDIHSINNELYDEYFKVRSVQRPSTTTTTTTTTTMAVGASDYEEQEQEEEEEEEGYAGLYLDSDDNNSQTLPQQKHAPPASTVTTMQNETWSLVEVAPFL